MRRRRSAADTTQRLCYCKRMKRWSVDTSELEKTPPAYAIWRLEQAINWGIGEGKISKDLLRRNWHEIDIDPRKRAFLALFME